MKKFKVKFIREFEVDVEAVDLPTAADLSKKVIAAFPEGTCRLLSIYPENWKAPGKELAVIATDPLSKTEAASLLRNEGLTKNVDRELR